MDSKRLSTFIRKMDDIGRSGESLLWDFDKNDQSPLPPDSYYEEFDSIFYDPNTDQFDGDFYNQFFLVMELIIATVGTLLNLAIMVTVLMSHQLRRSNSSTFIVSLSVSDLMVCSFVMIINALNSHGILVLARTLTGFVVCQMILFISVVALTSSSFNIVAISIDRYICIGDPWHYYSRVSRFKLIVALVCIWVISFTMALIPLSVETYKGIKNRVYEESEDRCMKQQSDIWKVSVVVITIMIPLIIITTIYTRIFIWAYTHIPPSRPVTNQASSLDKAKTTESPESIFDIDLSSKGDRTFNEEEHVSSIMEQISKEKDHVSNPLEQSSKEGENAFTLSGTVSTPSSSVKKTHITTNLRASLKSIFIDRIGSSHCKATLMLSIIVGGFILHWLPFGIINLIEVFSPDSLSPRYRSYCLWLLLLNSLWNPMIYSVSNAMYTAAAFRRAMILRCACGDGLSCTKSKRSFEHSGTSVMFPELKDPYDTGNRQWSVRSSLNVSTSQGHHSREVDTPGLEDTIVNTEGKKE